MTGLWPWPGTDDSGRNLLIENLRLEMSFDRDLAEQGLDDPSSWLGVWLLGPRLARRLPVTRAPGAIEHVSAPADGDAAAYAIGVEAESIRGSTVIMVMARSVVGGVIRAAGADQLALDADLAATGLSDSQRDQLWQLPPDGSNTAALGSLAKVAVQGPPAWLPSGNGTAGGDLHVVYRSATGVQLPPQLLSVWPPGGSSLTTDSPESADLLKRFLDRPRIEIVVSPALDPAAVASPDPWLRVWDATPDGDFLYGIRPIALLAGATQDAGDGTVRYVFPCQEDVQWYPFNQVLVQLRSTPPVAAGSPIGQDAPALLVDADFSGTALDSQTLFTIWSGGAPSGFPALRAISSAGVPLHDGVEGGLAHWGFSLTRP